MTVLCSLVVAGACLVSYFGLGLQQPFWAYLVIIFCTLYLAMLHVFVFGFLFDSFIEAATVGTVHLSALMCASGFFGPLELMPVWIRWCSYLSPQRYAIHALASAEFEENDNPLTCAPGTLCLPIPVNRAIKSLTILGQDINWLTDVMALLIYNFGFLVLCYLSVRFMQRKR